MGNDTEDELREQAFESFVAYVNLVGYIRCNQPNWRKGQAYFNVLSDVRPDLAERVRATILDPFYSDCRLADFLYFLRQAW